MMFFDCLRIYIYNCAKMIAIKLNVHAIMVFDVKLNC